ncbi:NmrA/HSCARG family protein [Mesorhizobium sp. M2E.F.Ca.ET.209.01.1.1]|uniref:NmrA family NAD(P)-binding protein n=1 Tax=Mesorhizobium sp. M2E.F.Ca.ET.209.01.1.1 TaxID=2500526 RepID=UPI000FD76943|nr:NmrA family NAD(P)-binding protein [Mesorhizobium sp. M2E.F.Ca.ET.209.01.1.1]TGS08807.1 NmrA/HSCARG family protein [Mesorhizobium sp. M2E.F.Ca.ET.209.01.1.1]
MMILAFGAAGNFAGSVIPALATRGARVRAFIRRPEQAELVRGHGATEVAIGDLRDRPALDAALKDVGAVFYIAPAFIPGEADVGKTVVKAAINAGIRRFVFSAVIHPVLSDLVNHVAKAPVEEAVLNSGLEYTFLHPARYFQNYAAFWPKVVKEGVLAEPWSSETRFSLVDYRDVAEVAAIALTEDRLLFGTFELCAPGQLDRHEVVALMSDVLGRKIGERRDPGVLGDVSQGLRAMFAHYDHHGLLGNPLTLRAILGREPRLLRAYLEELARGDPAGFGEQG